MYPPLFIPVVFDPFPWATSVVLHLAQYYFGIPKHYENDILIHASTKAAVGIAQFIQSFHQ